MAYKRVRRTYNDDGVFFCDFVSDIAELPGVGHTKIGSRAFVAENSQSYILSKSGWQAVESPWGEGGDDSGQSVGLLSAKELADGEIASTENLFDLPTGFYYGLIGNGDLAARFDGASATDMAYCTMIDTNGKSKYASIFAKGKTVQVEFQPDGTSVVY